MDKVPAAQAAGVCSHQPQSQVEYEYAQRTGKREGKKKNKEKKGRQHGMPCMRMCDSIGLHQLRARQDCALCHCGRCDCRPVSLPRSRPPYQTFLAGSRKKNKWRAKDLAAVGPARPCRCPMRLRSRAGKTAVNFSQVQRPHATWGLSSFIAALIHPPCFIRPVLGAYQDGETCTVRSASETTSRTRYRPGYTLDRQINADSTATPRSHCNIKLRSHKQPVNRQTEYFRATWHLYSVYREYLLGTSFGMVPAHGASIWVLWALKDDPTLFEVSAMPESSPTCEGTGSIAPILFS